MLGMEFVTAAMALMSGTIPASTATTLVPQKLLHRRLNYGSVLSVLKLELSSRLRLSMNLRTDTRRGNESWLCLKKK